MRRSLVTSRSLAIVLGALALAGCSVDPTPMTTAERSDRIATDLERIAQMEYVPTEPISLNTAIARAVAFNLEARVKEIESEIEEAKLRTRSVDMLPALEFDGTHTRNSQQLSATDDRLTTAGNATLTWNILDLGVSYSHARQQSEEILVARENQRKAFQDIVRRVRVAYWRAAGAERLMTKVQGLAANIKIAMQESRAMERSGANDIAKSVAYRREIVDSVRQALDVALSER